MSQLPITLACGPYDRTRALADGRVTVAGADLRYVALDPEEIFFRMVSHGEFDVSEMSLATYLVTREKGAPFIGIPVFPSRLFRHTSVYANRDRIPEAGGADPAAAARALEGKTVGVAEWQLTANVWIRGILADHYGVPVESVRYRTGGLNAPGRTLSDMLAVGELDAVYSPRTPRCFRAGNPAVRRLFSDVRGAEADYYRRTGIFPIMHVVVLRRDVYDAHRWAARSLFRALVAARDAAWQGIDETASLRYMLPWLPAELEATRAVLGANYWSYGLPGNEKTLATLIGYSHAQGLIRRAFAPAELFASEVLEDTVV